VPAVQKQIYSLDPDQPVTAVQTLNELLDVSRSQPRFTMFLLAALSSMASVLALVGIYGVRAYMVARRVPELGVRMALGADKADILRLIIGRGLFLTSTGVGVGLLVALATTQLLASLLYKVDVRDRTTFILLPAIFMLVGLAAIYLPARRAMRIEPSEALRGN
jgi:ABC-type antimicrobial peptide transport system permease subunit